MHEDPTDTFSICPVCFWEHGYDEDEEDGMATMANGVTLVEARQNYKDYGACSERDISLVRKPLPEETYLGA